MRHRGVVGEGLLRGFTRFAQVLALFIGVVTPSVVRGQCFEQRRGRHHSQRDLRFQEAR